MAIIRIKEIRGMKPEDRLKRMGEFRLELAKLKGSSAVGAAIKEPGKVKELRKAVARMLTIINEDKFLGKKFNQEKTGKVVVKNKTENKLLGKKFNQEKGGKEQ